MEKKIPLIEIEGDWYCPSVIVKLSRGGNYTVVQTSLNQGWPLQKWDPKKELYNKILEARGNITPSLPQSTPSQSGSEATS